MRIHRATPDGTAPAALEVRDIPQDGEVWRLYDSADASFIGGYYIKSGREMVNLRTGLKRTDGLYVAVYSTLEIGEDKV